MITTCYGQVSIQYSYTEDFTGAILHWMDFIWMLAMWKGKMIFLWKNFKMSSMGKNQYVFLVDIVECPILSELDYM